MLKANHDAAHRDSDTPLRRFRPEYSGPVGKRSDLRANRSSGGTVVVAVNNSLLRPEGDTTPFRVVMHFSRCLFAAFGQCCTIEGPVSANIISGQASVIAGVTVKIKGERVKQGSVNAPEPWQTCIHGKTAPGAAVSRRHWRCQT